MQISQFLRQCRSDIPVLFMHVFGLASCKQSPISEAGKLADASGVPQRRRRLAVMAAESESLDLSSLCAQMIL